MERSSISKTKNKLSSLIKRVKAGETVIIEDRGVPVAQLQPLTSTGTAEGRVLRLQQAGLVRLPREKVSMDIIKMPPPRPKHKIEASSILLDERRSGR